MISVYGGTGFIGSTFVQKYNNECVLIARNENAPKTNEILYFVSTVDNYNVFTNPHVDINTNLTKLIEVLEECRKVNETSPVTFNFISSWFVYGKTNDLPAKETSYCNPTGFYSITKYAAEKLLISYCETFGMSYRIFRLTNIIGVGDKKASRKKNAIQFMIESLTKNDPIKLYDAGTNIRDFMDVNDCCSAIKLCVDMAPKNEIINISNSSPTKIIDIIDYANSKLNSKSKIESIDTPEFHKIVQIKNMWLDNSKLLSYGYIPKTKVFESVDEIIKALL
jgi:nucleoside-diphosphate-sugar epimerase